MINLLKNNFYTMTLKIILVAFFLSFCIASFGQSENHKLDISPLTKNFYVYTTYRPLGGEPFPANGMYVVTEAGVVMFDAPWDTTQFQPLLDSIRSRHHKDVVACIATHFHADRTGGLEYYKTKGIKTYTTKRTDELSRTRNEKRGEYIMYKDTVFDIGGYRFQVFYPGPGHSPDNIVAWFDKEKILYGGCLIKSTEASDLGNLGDANVKEWPNTIKTIQNKFHNPNYIIPGHQDWKSKNSLTHTLDLLKENQKKNE
jgi:metallo-beta-lactamase class B